MMLTKSKMLHLLRNSWGHDQDAIREARIAAADRIEELERQLAERDAQQEKDAARARHRELGAAIDYACESLPEFYEVHLTLEKGAGSASLYDPDGDLISDEFIGDTFCYQVNNAVNTAIAHYEKHAALSAQTNQGETE